MGFDLGSLLPLVFYVMVGLTGVWKTVVREYCADLDPRGAF